MNVASLNQLVVPVAIALFFIACLLWPTVRTWRRTGIWPVTLHRVTDPAERVIGRAMGLIFVAIAVWAAAVPTLSPSTLAIWTAPDAMLLAGWLTMAVGLAITVVAQWQMGASWRIGIDDAPTPLVTGGLFRLVRNPIFSAMLLTLIGLVLCTPSPWTVVGAVYGATLIAVQTRLEEKHLLGIHGERYRSYAARVGRFVPGAGKLGAV